MTARDNTAPSYLGFSKFVKTGIKSRKNGWKNSEEIDKGTREQELVEIWKNSNRGSLEKFEYKRKDGVDEYGNDKFRIVSDTKPVYAYTNEDLKDRRSHICQNCVCHENCKGYYYEVQEVWNLTEQTNNPDILDSLKRRCECKQCKHFLNSAVLQK